MSTTDYSCDECDSEEVKREATESGRELYRRFRDQMGELGLFQTVLAIAFATVVALACALQSPPREGETKGTEQIKRVAVFCMGLVLVYLGLHTGGWI